MPVASQSCIEREEMLSFEDLLYAIQTVEKMGISAVRLTGGEPLLRREVWKLVELISDETDLSDIAMTTNGYLLGKYASNLAEAGLDRVNVSLDSLEPERYEKMTRFGEIENVWSGIEAAAEAGLTPIKINALALKGFNNDEFEQWLELTRDHDLSVRFMELMPIGQGAKMSSEHGEFLDLTETRKRLVDKFGLVPDSTPEGNGPARYWTLPEGEGNLGFITPISNSYCQTCSRLRLTATGDIRACLAHDETVSAAESIRDRDRAGVKQAFTEALQGKPKGHKWREGETTSVSMSKIGG
jgi:cyclic pyranopterin phosphate synthase